eukprot:TRINITY_DN3000_c0_g1_i1.p1 TRINITY_DN3000_c0_g1~~TRINITY_DN3000_c0_g1_i1.p1  ORF type:complete len:790 (-),score=294.15 TRINITY_DN3000_c0_g1_i1:444-2813(-)
MSRRSERSSTNRRSRLARLDEELETMSVRSDRRRRLDDTGSVRSSARRESTDLLGARRRLTERRRGNDDNASVRSGISRRSAARGTDNDSDRLVARRVRNGERAEIDDRSSVRSRRNRLQTDGDGNLSSRPPRRRSLVDNDESLGSESARLSSRRRGTTDEPSSYNDRRSETSVARRKRMLDTSMDDRSSVSSRASRASRASRVRNTGGDSEPSTEGMSATERLRLRREKRLKAKQEESNEETNLPPRTTRRERRNGGSSDDVLHEDPSKSRYFKDPGLSEDNYEESDHSEDDLDIRGGDQSNLPPPPLLNLKLPPPSPELNNRNLDIIEEEDEDMSDDEGDKFAHKTSFSRKGPGYGLKPKDSFLSPSTSTRVRDSLKPTASFLSAASTNSVIEEEGDSDVESVELDEPLGDKLMDGFVAQPGDIDRKESEYDVFRPEDIEKATAVSTSSTDESPNASSHSINASPTSSETPPPLPSNDLHSMKNKRKQSGLRSNTIMINSDEDFDDESEDDYAMQSGGTSLTRKDLERHNRRLNGQDSESEDEEPVRVSRRKGGSSNSSSHSRSKRSRKQRHDDYSDDEDEYDDDMRRGGKKGRSTARLSTPDRDDEDFDDRRSTRNSKKPSSKRHKEDKYDDRRSVRSNRSGAKRRRKRRYDDDESSEDEDYDRRSRGKRSKKSKRDRSSSVDSYEAKLIFADQAKALQTAIVHGRNSAVKSLLRKNPKLARCIDSRTGNSMLHFACMFDNMKVSMWLLEAGATSRVRNNEDEKPKDLANSRLRKAIREAERFLNA